MLAAQLIVSVPLTQDGAVYLDEQEKALAISAVLLFAGDAGGGSNTYPTYRRSSSQADRKTPTDRPAGGSWRSRNPSDTPPPARSATTATGSFTPPS